MHHHDHVPSILSFDNLGIITQVLVDQHLIILSCDATILLCSVAAVLEKPGAPCNRLPAASGWDFNSFF